MERKFIKRDANTKKLIASGALSPQTKDYIYSLVPKPCKHFCGRDNELEKLHTMFAKVRAIENHTPFAYVNAIGNDGTYTYCGQSCLIDADGQSIAKAEEQDILLIGEVAIGAALEDKNMDYLQNRRQDIY